jgi:homoserine kinase
LRIHCESDIPQKAGIGSSAAATIAGLRLYSMVNGPLSRRELLESACALEGHPDNAAAALFGGLTASCKLDDCSVASVNLRWPESLCLVVLTPKLTLSTSTARNVLPPEVSRVDAVFNLQRMALLIYALENADFRLLHEAARDRLHQPQRQALVPGLDAMLKIQHPDILGVCLSGSGPSIVALAHQNFGEVERELASSFEPFQVPFQIRTLRVHKQGAHVS